GAECQEQIAGFKGAKYKKFATEEEADAFVKGTLKTPTTSTRQIARKVTNNLPSGSGSDAEESAENDAGPTAKRARTNCLEPLSRSTLHAFSLRSFSLELEPSLLLYRYECKAKGRT
ncbi:hypothetical protein AAVH_26101, partial [Aphelenchoides avenae]